MALASHRLAADAVGLGGLEELLLLSVGALAVSAAVLDEATVGAARVIDDGDFLPS